MSEHFHFIRIECLWLLPVLILGVLLFKYFKHPRTQNDDVCDERLLPFISYQSHDGAIKISERSIKWAKRMILLGLILSIFALAGPSWQRVPTPLMLEKRPLVIALDISQSMDATDTLPSRLQRAKHKIFDILDKYSGNQLGLLVFSRHAHVVVPMTQDVKTIKQMLQGIDSSLLPYKGVDISSALIGANGLLSQINESQGQILIMTDGLSKKGYERASALKLRHPVSIIDFAKEDTPMLDREGKLLYNPSGELIIAKKEDADLKKLAQHFGGVYTSVSMDDEDINTVLHSKGLMDTDLQDSAQFYDIYQDEGPRLLWIALVFFILGILILGYQSPTLKKHHDVSK
jgi:Ca-activated chloride channel family protein